MINLDTFICTGNLTRDFTDTKTGLYFGIAHNRGYKDKNTNEWVNIADFFNCVMRIQNEDYKNSLKQKFHKGESVVIFGEVQTWPFTNNDTGKKELSTMIIVTKIEKIEGYKVNDNSSHTTTEPDTPPSFLDGIEDQDYDQDPGKLPFN